MVGSFLKEIHSGRVKKIVIVFVDVLLSLILYLLVLLILLMYTSLIPFLGCPWRSPVLPNQGCGWRGKPCGNGHSDCQGCHHGWWLHRGGTSPRETEKDEQRVAHHVAWSTVRVVSCFFDSHNHNEGLPFACAVKKLWHSLHYSWNLWKIPWKTINFPVLLGTVKNNIQIAESSDLQLFLI